MARELMRQNRADQCPPDILDLMTILRVPYESFSGREYIGMITVAKELAPDVSSFFERSVKLGFVINKVALASDYGWDDGRIMKANVSTGFNYRNIAGTDQLSMHALGRAFDINPRQNPYIRYTGEGRIVEPEGSLWQPSMPGTLSDGHPLVTHMQDRGWEWGGSWPKSSGRTDFQHFEKS